ANCRGADHGAREPSHPVAAPCRHRNPNLRRMRMRSRFPLFSAAAAALLLAACGSTSTAGGSGSQTVSLKIMVGGLNKQIYLPNMLAQRLGYFSEQHRNVTLIDEGRGRAYEDE